MLSLLKNTKLIRVMGSFASGTTARKSSGVDCRGLDTVLFIADIGTFVADGTVVMKLQGSDTDVDGNYVDLEGCEKTTKDGDDDKLMVLELVRPIHRYNRYVLTPTVGAAITNGIALCGVHQRTLPTTRDDTVSHYGYESFISPEVES